MACSIRDVAARAGVSPATVSRVMNEKGYISESMRLRVEHAARELCFQPKPYRRQTKPAFGSIIGVLIPDICNTYYMEVIHGIESLLEPEGVEVLICNTDEDPAKEARCLTTLQHANVSGVIAVPVSDREAYNADRLIELNRSGIPVVLLDRDIHGSDMDGVFMDNFNSAYQSVQAFYQQGHRHIAIIAGPETSTSGQLRLSGYKAALRANHLPVREEYILHGDFKFELAYHLTERLLDAKTPVTAIFSSNSRMSRGCLAAIAERGLHVPSDMAFISCGRLDGNFDAISSVDYPTQAIGQECARIALEKMQKNTRAHPCKRITFTMELTLRGSEIYPRTEQKNQQRKDDQNEKNRHFDETETR